MDEREKAKWKEVLARQQREAEQARSAEPEAEEGPSRLEDALAQVAQAYLTAPPNKGLRAFFDAIIRLSPVIITEGGALQLKQVVDTLAIINDRLMMPQDVRIKESAGEADGERGMQRLRERLNQPALPAPREDKDLN